MALFACSREAGCAANVCRLQIRDPQTDRVMAERVCVCCSRVVSIRLTGNLAFLPQLILHHAIKL